MPRHGEVVRISSGRRRAGCFRRGSRRRDTRSAGPWPASRERAGRPGRAPSAVRGGPPRRCRWRARGGQVSAASRSGSS